MLSGKPACRTCACRTRAFHIFYPTFSYTSTSHSHIHSNFAPTTCCSCSRDNSSIRHTTRTTPAAWLAAGESRPRNLLEEAQQCPRRYVVANRNFPSTTVDDHQLTTSQKKTQPSEKSNEKPSETLVAARSAVLNTTELLEAIMIYLPIKKIFAIQRVSRRFRDIIGKSVQIQQKLFIKPCAKEEIWKLAHLPPRPGQTGEDFESEPKLVFAHSAETAAENAKSLFVPAILCPILDATTESVPVTDRLWLNDGDYREIQLTALIKRPGSWELTQLTDPPCKHMRFSIHAALEDSRGKVRAYSDPWIHIERLGGIVLGDILPAAMAARMTFYDAIKERRSVDYDGDTGLLQDCPRLRNAVTGNSNARLIQFYIFAEFENMVLPDAEEWEAVTREALCTEPAEQAKEGLLR